MKKKNGEAHLHQLIQNRFLTFSSMHPKLLDYNICTYFLDTKNGGMCQFVALHTPECPNYHYQKHSIEQWNIILRRGVFTETLDNFLRIILENWSIFQNIFVDLKIFII